MRWGKKNLATAQCPSAHRRATTHEVVDHVCVRVCACFHRVTLHTVTVTGAQPRFIQSRDL
jgi:hypothetical protein